MSQKTIHLTSDHNFSKCRPIFTILSLTDTQGNGPCNYCMAKCIVFWVTVYICTAILLRISQCNTNSSSCIIAVAGRTLSAVQKIQFLYCPLVIPTLICAGCRNWTVLTRVLAASIRICSSSRCVNPTLVIYCHSFRLSYFKKAQPRGYFSSGLLSILHMFCGHFQQFFMSHHVYVFFFLNFTIMFINKFKEKEFHM